MRSSLLALFLLPALFGAESRPRVRCVTAFVEIDRANYTGKIEEAVAFLNKARTAYQAAGYEVQTIRIATQPFPKYTSGIPRDQAVKFLEALDALGKKLQYSTAIGPAMLNDADATAPVDILAATLTHVSLNASLVVAADDGIHWNAVRQSARLIKSLADHSPHGDANNNFAAIAMLGPDDPFFPGAYTLGSGHSFGVGVEGANIVADVFARDHDPRTAEKSLTQALTQHLRDAEGIATKLAASSGWSYVGLDPTPAPLGNVSIGRAMESFAGGPFGSSGTMTAAAIITRAVQAVPVKRIGYSGIMLPVLQDEVLSRRWAEATFNIDSLLAYSAVCAGGLDTVPLPGDVTENYIAGIVGDVATLAYKWHKPLAARLLPAPGKKPGDRTEFSDSRVINTTVRPLK